VRSERGHTRPAAATLTDGNQIAPERHLYPVTGAAPPMLDYARAGCDILCGCPQGTRLLGL
jgi:hypothetical protein